MAVGRITQDEVLEAIRAAVAQAPPADDGAHTVEEYRAMLGWSVPRMRDAIRAMLAHGTMETVKVRRLALDGRLSTLPAYRLKVSPKPRKK